MVPLNAQKNFIDRIVLAKEFDGKNSTWWIFFLMEGIKLTGHVTPQKQRKNPGLAIFPNINMIKVELIATPSKRKRMYTLVAFLMIHRIQGSATAKI